MLPRETIDAIYPPRVSIALAHCAALEALGVSVDAPLDESNALLALWIMSVPAKKCADIVTGGRAAFHYRLWSMRFMIRARFARATPAQIVAVAQNRLSANFAAIVPPKRISDEKCLEPRGLGWPLEMADWYMAEYGATFDEAMLVPLPRLFALVACSRVRNGGEHGGPDYFERVTLRSLKNG